MPKLFKARLTDCGRMRAEDVKPSVKPPVKPVVKSIRDNMARKTLVATYFGPEYESLRSVDDLQVFDCSNESQPPKLVCSYPGSAFIAESGSNELCVYWMSADPVGTSTIGDRSGPKMSPARFQSEIVNKVRRLAAGGLR